MHESPAAPRRRRHKASAPISPAPALIGSVAFSPEAVEQLADAIAARLLSKAPASLSSPIDISQPVLLTARQFCEQANICRTTFYELTKAGRINVVKIGKNGRNIRVPFSEVARVRREGLA